METVNLYETLLGTLKKGLWMTTFAGCMLTPGLQAYGAESTASTATKASNTANADQIIQDQTAEKRKEIVAEAVAAVSETMNALVALDKEDKTEALASLERATGKLETALAREPKLALAPVSVTVVTYDTYGTVDAIKAARKKAEDFLDDGKCLPERTG